MSAIGKEEYLNLINSLEDGIPLMDVAVEMGKMGFNSLELNESPIYLMGSFGPGNAIDPNTHKRLRVVSFAYQTKSRPIHYILIGTPETGWNVTSEDVHDISNFEVFLDFLLQAGNNKTYRMSFENTGLTKDKIHWSGEKVVTIPGADFTG